MELIAIVAIAPNNVIGKKGTLPWNYPEDLQHFKKTTSGHTVIMGRKTFESIGRPLPKRVNIVLSRKAPDIEGVVVLPTLEDGINYAKAHGEKKAFLIGGGQIYKEALEKGLVDTLIITHLKKEYEGDAFFPEIDSAAWKAIEREPHDEFDFITYVKR